MSSSNIYRCAILRAWALVPVLVTVVLALLFGCTRDTVPCPKNSSTMVYNGSTNTIKPVGTSLGGSDIQHNKNGLIKGKPIYKNPKAK